MSKTDSMLQPAIQQTFERALQHHVAGRLREAERLYLQVLATQPDHADTLHGLGMIAHKIGRNDIATELIRRSITLNPSAAYFYNDLGNVLKNQGRYEEAIASFQKALTLKPDYVDAHNNLGIAFKRQGRLDEAIVCYRRALTLKPELAEAHNNLGIALKDQGRLEEAIAAFQQALALKPEYAAASNNLGVALKDQERMEEAIAAFQRALTLKPDFVEAHNNLGNALLAEERREEAMVHYQSALAFKPDLAEAHNNLGIALKDLGRLAEALVHFQQAFTLKPDYSAAYNNLGITFKDLGRFDEAIAAFQHALLLKPDFAKAYNNLGNAFRDQGRLNEAVAAFQQALTLNPDFAEAHLNLGNTSKDQGRLDEAIIHFQRALDLKPGYPSAYSNLVYTLEFHPGYDSKAIAKEHQGWNLRFAEPLKKAALPHSNERDPERKLRVGYVSPDFRGHPVGRFLLPLIEHHNRQNFELFAYAQVTHPDAITGRFRALIGNWRDTVGVSDAQLADQIRRDGIDVLIDLTMHMEDNRLLVFARKPAPVQATWLAYCSSTALEAIDYRLSDPYLDPPGGNDSFYSEETIRLRETYWCYQPTGREPEVNPLPALKKGFVTFACLNNFAKLNEPILAIWRRILQAVPQSRLLIHTAQGDHRQQFLQGMERSGIEAQRIQFAGKLPMKEYFGLYHGIDLALDPAPYGGGTTTCDALWMGAPVVSLAGKRAVGRSGLSILSNIGLPELVGATTEEYVQIAVDLAGNLERLAELRATLRQRMQASPLMNAPQFARDMEEAYRMMWNNWCGRKSHRQKKLAFCQRKL